MHPKLVPGFVQPGDLVADVFTDALSAAVAYSKFPRHQALAGCEPDPQCLPPAKEFLLNCFAQAAFETCTNVRLSVDGAEAADVAACLVLKVEASSPL